jgi:hypothetical protein
VDFEEEG